MNIYKISHIGMFKSDRKYLGKIDWQLYTPLLKAKAVKHVKDSEKTCVFNSNSFARREAYLEESLFWPEGFFALEDLLLGGGNQAECGLFEDQVVMFRVNPVAPDCGEPFPTYAKIAECLPNDLHYFIKYPDTDFRLVTETFVQRVQALGLKSMKFVLRWDGKRSYPILPGEKRE